MNIGPAQRRRRAVVGAIGLAAGATLLLAASPLAEPLRLALAIGAVGVIFGGFVGVLQARGKT